jgi:hypothetical protein
MGMGGTDRRCYNRTRVAGDKEHDEAAVTDARRTLVSLNFSLISVPSA